MLLGSTEKEIVIILLFCLSVFKNSLPIVLLLNVYIVNICLEKLYFSQSLKGALVITFRKISQTHECP